MSICTDRRRSQARSAPFFRNRGFFGDTFSGRFDPLLPIFTPGPHRFYCSLPTAFIVATQGRKA